MKLLDVNGVLITEERGTSVHTDTQFTEEDAFGAMQLLTALGLDMLIFGWEETDNAKLHERQRGHQET